jgi:hypothetical protein
LRLASTRLKLRPNSSFEFLGAHLPEEEARELSFKAWAVIAKRDKRKFQDDNGSKKQKKAAQVEDAAGSNDI